MVMYQLYVTSNIHLLHTNDLGVIQCNHTKGVTFVWLYYLICIELYNKAYTTFFVGKV